MASARAQQLGRLAEAGRWWEVVAAPAAAFDDPDTLLIEARAWIELGLGTLAERTLDRLCAAFPAGSNHPSVIELRERAAELAHDRTDDQLDASEIARRAESACTELQANGVDLSDALDRWKQASTGAQTSLAADGNAVRRRHDGSLELVGDHRAASRSLIDQHRDALANSPAPITIEGLDPPWLALDMLAATEAAGYAPAIRIVQADAAELIDGLTLLDDDARARLIGSPRVEWFVGTSAPRELASMIEREPGVIQQGPVVPLATLRTRCGPALAAAMQSAHARQQTRHSASLTTIRTRDTESDTHRRAATIANDSGDRPRRVALIAGRFTTVLRPMVEDLAVSFGRLGWESHIITEPSDHRRLGAAAYSHAFDTFDPDLIVCANHTRDDMDRLLGERVMPASVPWVTWVQDAMPHLLRAEAGSAIGPTDLAIGHITSAMREQFGYTADRSISVPMVASEQKFSPDRADPSLSRELACEVAAFTNHSETPQQMRSRLIDEVSGSPGAAAVVERVADASLALAQEPIERVHAWHRCETLLDAEAPGADPGVRENLLQNVALRVYDRACRHRALEWASRVCDRNNWRFALYGSGWDAHTTLARHARGTIEHGTPICSAYAAARVTLDANILSTVHQRVAECALAGGLPAVLVTGSALTLARAALKRVLCTELADQAVPAANEPSKIAFPTYRVPEADRFARLGSLANGRSYPYAVFPPLTTTPPIGTINADDVVDLLTLGAHDEASLQHIMTHAGDDDWRSAQRSRVLDFVRANCTHAVLAERITAHYAKLATAQTAAA